MSAMRAYLIVRADQTVRVTKRWPNLRRDEVAFRLDINFPSQPWGHIQSENLKVDLPDQPPPSVEVGASTWPQSERVEVPDHVDWPDEARQ